MSIVHNGIVKTVGIIGLGVAAGVLLHKYWPLFTKRAKPSSCCSTTTNTTTESPKKQEA